MDKAFFKSAGRSFEIPNTDGLGGREWQDLSARFESPPEGLERAEHVVCQPCRAAHVVATGQYNDSAKEIFRVLCQHVWKVREQRRLRSVLVTSPLPQDGKTVVVINLAATLARNSPRVLLVDADLRHPSFSALGCPPRPGLAEYLAGEIELSEAIRCVDPLGFYFLPAGHSSLNPADLLQKPSLRGFMGQATVSFDWIIFDSPPLNLFAETRHLATLVDGVLLVIREGVTTREATGKSLAALDGAFVAGVVFNARTHTPEAQYYPYYATKVSAHPSG